MSLSKGGFEMIELHRHPMPLSPSLMPAGFSRQWCELFVAPPSSLPMFINVGVVVTVPTSRNPEQEKNPLPLYSRSEKDTFSMQLNNLKKRS